VYKLILVDDEPWALMGLAELLDWSRLGFDIVAQCTDSREALELIIRLKPDAVCTDIRMPDLSGIELIKEAKQQGSEAEFVLISSYQDFNAAQKAIKLEVCQYLLKPYNEDEVQETACLLKDRLRKRSKAVLFNIHDNLSYSHEQQAFLKKTIEKYPFFCVYFSDQPKVDIVGNRNVSAVSVEVKNIPTAYIITVRDTDGKSLTELLHLENGVGLSTLHSDTREFGEALKEAQHSLNYNFTYVPNQTVSEIQKFICEKLIQSFSLKEVSDRYHFTETYLCNIFKKHTDQTFVGFLHMARINYAARLIRQTNEDLQSIADKLGYDNYGYFSKRFKKQLGISPNDYKNKKD
jgi:two-component system response regulator YesN